jgi:5-methylcytosine-specific restriction endonuclease McrA
MPGEPMWKEPSRVRERKQRNRTREAEREEVYAAVDRRDRYRCRVCGHRADPKALGLTERGHRHHIIYRSRGGRHTSWNVVLLCAGCHEEIHAKRLFVSGNADEELIVERVSR